MPKFTDEVLQELALSEAIANFLSDWSAELDNSEILQAIAEGSGQITVWEPFEFYDGERIVEHIESMAGGIYRLLVSVRDNHGQD